MDIDHLVKIITREVLKQLQAEEGSRETHSSRPRLLALFTGGSIGFKQSLREMERLAQWAQVQVVLSRTASEIYPDEQIFGSFSDLPVIKEGNRVSLHKLLDGVGIVTVPVLTFNSLAKLAVGISDTLILNIVMHCLMSGTPVVAAKNAANLQDQERKSLSMYRCSPGLLQLANEYLKKLEVLGIEVVDVSQLAERARALAFSGEPVKPAGGGKREVITQEDITQEVIRQGSLRVPANAILTPLAQDLIQSHGLVIYHE
ncbi:hypothetical protein BR63_18120 [Thermanaerosceptrum fracticalcis]|uniref:Flavoprotein domain-containing protein n=1 Tax=Thermanaerosceptrum fracticalcis TaxID=1712410 RepID=A0A7G6E7F5_THEFR|nr:flavoprotein [Thermanaerosceptrum fracticalcis]QNB48009.1 hypothetical protein BR63_18120 [Thermanaerosceptrum fracticalcis]